MTVFYTKSSYSFVTNIPPKTQMQTQGQETIYPTYQAQTHFPDPIEISPYFTNIGASLLPRHDPNNRIVMDTSSSSFISNDSILIE